jgi:hypothetical protein
MCYGNSASLPNHDSQADAAVEPPRLTETV